MPSQQCLNNIASEKPPYNVPCTEPFCVKTRYARGIHCSERGLPMDTPVLSWDPAIEDSCYCCCSCYALNTPIEASKGEFVLIQNINAGDSIMTTGLDLKWKEGIVKERTGDINTSMVPGLYMVSYDLPGEKEPRQILVTPDHLFLMHTTKTLKKVQHLIPGNKLMTADGKAAIVHFVAHGEYETSIQSINMKEEFNGKDLTGHLINANGIVSTDYAVQAYYETHHIDDSFRFKFSDESNVHEVGTKAYIAKFKNPKLDAFLADPKAWPKGFMPKRKALVNIPAGSKSFVTAAQAKDIQDSSEFNEYTNGTSRNAIHKMFRIFMTNNNNVNFILDWSNDEVNAYSWTLNNQNFVLVTGGLARLKGLYVDGYTLIISDMITRLFGNRCVAESDYNSFNIMRDMLPDSIYADLTPQAIRQVQECLFDKISKKNAGGNPANVCESPSIACRTESFWSGFSFLPMPECGMPVAPYFSLVKAYASYDLKSVTVVFDTYVDKASGESLINYNIEPGVAITAAKVSQTEPASVILSVTGLKPKTRYILSVNDVTSIKNQPLKDEAYVIIVTA